MYVQKILIDNVRMSYNGLFSVMGFFEEIDKWAKKNGFDKEIKKHLEYAEQDGRRIEWIFEFWKEVRDFARITIRLRVLCHNMQEVEITRGASKEMLDKGDALTLVDGILIQDVYGRWQQKPMFYFLRAMIDKYLYKFHKYKFEAETEGYVHDLQKYIMQYFKKQKQLIVEPSEEGKAVHGSPVS